MFAWVLGAYAVVVLVLLAAAGFTAIRVPDAEHRKDAYRVLKLILTTVTGAGGAAAALLKLHHLGLL